MAAITICSDFGAQKNIEAPEKRHGTDSKNTKGETKDRRDTIYYEAFILFWLLDQTGSLHIWGYLWVKFYLISIGIIPFKSSFLEESFQEESWMTKSYWIQVQMWQINPRAKPEKYSINQKPRGKLYYNLAVSWPYDTLGTGKSNQSLGVYNRKKRKLRGEKLSLGGQHCQSVDFLIELLAGTQHYLGLRAVEPMCDLQKQNNKTLLNSLLWLRPENSLGYKYLFVKHSDLKYFIMFFSCALFPVFSPHGF